MPTNPTPRAQQAPREAPPDSSYQGWLTTTRAFLADLEKNNERDWFNARKPHFKAEIEAPARELVEDFAFDLTDLTGVPHEGKLGRIYRDVRFSNDKSPYNPYLHMYWTDPDGTVSGWLLRVRSGGLTLMTGLHALDGPGVRSYRAAVDTDGDVLVAALASAQATVGGAFVDWSDHTLKRVPKPYPPDHPHGELLRRKELVVGAALPEGALSEGPLVPMNEVAEGLLPFWQWCRAAMGR